MNGLGKGGGDWTTWHVRDLTTGADLPDRIEHAKYYAPVFTRDGTGIFYARFPAPPAGKELVEPDHDAGVYFHRLGTPATDDVVVYERPEHPGWQFEIDSTKDGRYLVISIGEDGQVGDRAQEQIVVLRSRCARREAEGPRRHVPRRVHPRRQHLHDALLHDERRRADEEGRRVRPRTNTWRDVVP